MSDLYRAWVSQSTADDYYKICMRSAKGGPPLRLETDEFPNRVTREPEMHQRVGLFSIPDLVTIRDAINKFLETAEKYP